MKSLKYRLIRQSQDSKNHDVREYTSINNSKDLPFPTKDKYKKYITKKRSASRGVFEYEKEANKPQPILTDIKNTIKN